MLISHQERPRELRWYHAGPLLYGDWGTSRFYVLGLAFYFALFSSFWYILGVGALVIAVGWAYTVVCRVYPDGGGVYSAARQLSPLLSVVGALMLFANYAVTAALSALDGMHYLGLESDSAVHIGSVIAIAILCVVNYVGARHAGRLALVIAVATLALTVVLAIFCIPHLSTGWNAIRPMEGSAGHRWTTLVSVVLALSGVEVVANMTGIMVKPVATTAKKSIYPVMAEVIVFNIILGIAMLGLPAALQARGPDRGSTPTEFTQPAVNYQEADRLIDAYRHANPGWHKAEGQAAYHAHVAQVERDVGPHSSRYEEAIKYKVLRVMGEVYVHPWFGALCGVVFGLLLLSAVNTVIGGMMSVAYVMARDGEAPRVFSRLNLFGVPWVGLIPALIVPVILLYAFPTLELLADLYAIGVVGAISINLSCCTVNMKLPVKMWERVAIGGIAAVMLAIELTLAVRKPHALLFVGVILLVGLVARFVTQALPGLARARREAVRPATDEAPAPPPLMPGPLGPPLSAFATPAEQLDMSRPTVLVATRGGKRLLEFAARYARQANANLFVIYVRQFNLQFGPQRAPTFEEDRDARSTFAAALEAAKSQNVAMVPIYAVSADVAYTILDFAATYNAATLLMGVSRTGAVLRALRGDVLTAVADNLPPDIPLLIHA